MLQYKHIPTGLTVWANTKHEAIREMLDQYGIAAKYDDLIVINSTY